MFIFFNWASLEPQYFRKSTLYQVFGMIDKFVLRFEGCGLKYSLYIDGWEDRSRWDDIIYNQRIQHKSIDALSKSRKDAQFSSTN